MQPVIRENIRLNGLSNVRLHRLALSDSAGDDTLFLRSNINNASSRLGHRFRLGFGSETVPTQTLDAFCDEQRIERVRLMKVDCEGSETRVFGACRSVLERRVFDVIALEYHPHIIGSDACRNIHERLSASGYRLADWLGQTIYYSPAASSDLAAISPDIVLEPTRSGVD